MSYEVTKANAGAEPSPVVVDNLSTGQFALRGKPQAEPPPPEKEEVETQEEQAEPEADTLSANPKQPKEGKGQEESEKPKDVLSQNLDLDSLTEVELKELAEKLGSRAVARFGELTAKRKHAEEQLQALQAELQRRNTEQDPLKVTKKEVNPYASIDKVADLQAKAKEVEEVIEWAEETLWNSDHLAADDVAATVDGREVTKAQVRKALREAQKARKEFLPAQYQEVLAREQRKQQKAQLQHTMRQELPWLEGEDNDTRKQYEALRESPLLKKAVEAVPELEPYMEYMVAHAANSVYGRKSIPLETPAKRLDPKPPASPSATAAASSKPEGREAKSLKEMEGRLEKSGAIGDFIALRTAKLSKRKSI
jgi:hypothetical protein